MQVVGDPYDQTICLQKQQISELCKNPNNFKITFIFDTKIKMLTPLAQFPTITFKIATDSVSKIVSHFQWKSESGEHWTGNVCALLLRYN